MDHTKRELNQEELDKVTGGFVIPGTADYSSIKWFGTCPNCGESIASYVMDEFSGTCPHCKQWISVSDPDYNKDSPVWNQSASIRQK